MARESGVGKSIGTGTINFVENGKATVANDSFARQVQTLLKCMQTLVGNPSPSA
jgi:hypothetical protein